MHLLISWHTSTTKSPTSCANTIVHSFFLSPNLSCFPNSCCSSPHFAVLQSIISNVRDEFLGSQGDEVNPTIEKTHHHHLSDGTQKLYMRQKELISHRV